MMAKSKMFNKKLITAGLVVFVAIVTSPIWLNFVNFGKSVPAPELVLSEKAQAAGECVRDTDYMKTSHMQLLDTWRDSVVRDGNRIYVNAEGKSFNMSLTKTCLDCHSNKAEFCDRCHNYASVTPYCWDCHIDNPKEIQ
jgi:hypothetical protein